jgi:hypothetical protein
MELPDDVLSVIKEFTRPITRPDWRHCRLMNAAILHSEIAENYNTKFIPVIERFVQNYNYSTYMYCFKGERIYNITKIY